MNNSIIHLLTIAYLFLFHAVELTQQHHRGQIEVFPFTSNLSAKVELSLLPLLEPTCSNRFIKVSIAQHVLENDFTPIGVRHGVGGWHVSSGRTFYCLYAPTEALLPHHRRTSLM